MEEAFCTNEGSLLYKVPIVRRVSHSSQYSIISDSDSDNCASCSAKGVRQMFKILHFVISCWLFSVNHSTCPPTRVVVFGATGRTGNRIVSEFLSPKFSNVKIICPVRSMKRGRHILGAESSKLSLIPFDIEKESPSKLCEVLRDAIVVCAAAYKPSNGVDLFGPFKVDNLKTKELIEACASANVSRFVLVSSLLTNGFRSGQTFNPQFLLLNAFGGVLVNKRQAELRLQDQKQMQFTIVRPGGLKDGPAVHPILFAGPDTLSGGSISRDQVATVVCQSCFQSEAANKIVEIISSPDAKEVTVRQGFSGILRV